MKKPGAIYQSESDRSIPAIAMLAQWDNEQLINRAIDGDPVAENAIYRQHARYLLNLATRLTRSTSEGDDVVQETFIVAFRKLDRLENPEALRSWLTRILISKVRKSLRVRRMRAFFGFKSIEDDATLQMCATHDARPDLRTELRELDKVLDRTPIEWRTVWMLHRIEGMSIRETALASGRSVATTKRYVAAVDNAVETNRRLAP
ncbi:MAG: RNA polymerase sigma factor [Deltaproteobacteria bacterium]|nr:RNA polymerase sigma factor [Deltaproteobacteria bacterium]